MGECGFEPQLLDDGTYLCVLENNHDVGFFNVKFLIPAMFAPFIMEINKTVTVVDHKGGTATASFTVEVANVPSGSTPDTPATGNTLTPIAVGVVLMLSVAILAISLTLKKKQSGC